MFRLFLLLWLVLLVPYFALAQSYDVEIFANVPGCGNAVIEAPEQCDGGNLGGSSCRLLGFSSGSLSCSSVCTLVTSACVLNPPQTGSTQIGSSYSDVKPSILSSNLVVTGYSAPNARITLLKDGVAAGTTFVDQNGYFQITISGLTPGDFLLKLTASLDGFESVITNSFIGKVYKDSTTKISGISLPPFSQVGGNSDVRSIIIKSVPNSSVVLEVGGGSYVGTIDGSGSYTFSGLDEVGAYRVGLIYQGETTWTPLRILDQIPVGACGNEIDITKDCRVNFVDFAITLWWYLYNSAESPVDFDGNGRLDLVDFSILAYYWTG